MIKNFWFAAKSPLGVTYPCRCRERSRRSCGSQWCPCWGRADVMAMPPDCCARRNLRTIEAIHREARRLLDISLGISVRSSP